MESLALWNNFYLSFAALQKPTLSSPQLKGESVSFLFRNQEYMLMVNCSSAFYPRMACCDFLMTLKLLVVQKLCTEVMLGS